MPIKRPHNPKAPAFVRKWRRTVSVGCSHGDLADVSRQDEVIAFCQRFKPEIKFELGDVIDTAAFRSGARGTKDEATAIEPDKLAAAEWLRRYEPTHLSWGNHDWRLVQWQGHPNAIVSYAAATVWERLQVVVRELHTKTVPYHIQNGWFDMGGVFFGHGFMYSENALRDHSEMLGGRVVMAHIHRPEMAQGRIRPESSSFCVGTLANLDKLDYADRNRSKNRWGAGLVMGEMCETESNLWLVSAAPGKPLMFPPGY